MLSQFPLQRCTEATGAVVEGPEYNLGLPVDLSSVVHRILVLSACNMQEIWITDAFFSKFQRTFESKKFMIGSFTLLGALEVLLC